MLRYFFLTLFIFATSLVFAQDSQDIWKSTLEKIKEDQVLEIMLTSADSVKKMNIQCLDDLTNACQKVQYMQGPDCRCLPTVEKRLVIFLKENKILVIEVIKDHWFCASFIDHGRTTPFILRDKENVLFDTVQKLTAPKCFDCSKCKKPCKSE